MNPVSPDQVRAMMQAIPSWARMLPGMRDDTPFDDTGMDSLALLELIEELQRNCGLEIPDEDVARISTITSTARYLTERAQ